MSIRDDEVRIPVDGTELYGTLIVPAQRRPGVLFVHGWGGSQEQYRARARAVAALGCSCLVFDLRGHARDELAQATVSREQNLADIVAAYDCLRAHESIDPDLITVVGSSYGGYLAAILTETRSVRALALRVPALYEDVGWMMPKLQLHREQDLPAYRRRVVTPDENRALRACAAFQGDVLLVESEYDELIPPQVIKSYKEACVKARTLTYRRIDGADHGLTSPTAQHDYTLLLSTWLKEVLFGARKVPPPPHHIASSPESPPQELTR